LVIVGRGAERARAVVADRQTTLPRRRPGKHLCSRALLSGRLITHAGAHYTVETARIYSTPELPPPVFMSGLGEKAIKLAGRLATSVSSEHYDVSVACAEHGLWPAVRDPDPGTAVLADGFSCRTQIQAGRLGREGIHLAQLLAGMLDGSAGMDHRAADGNGG
jgi:alkanesulfonate monooxygenase SsuD/methylene tetrahydromethanopterin reductase-like flavin-dependent oxidoreductase (luciferase family)